MRYKGFDLNLLVALDTLIEHASVSRASEQLGMSQPAMSAALGRLRTYFDDPILGAHGKRMIPTAHALTLQPMVRELLTSVEALISVSSGFDPATSQRHFRIGSSDFIATVIFHNLMPELARLAPLVTLELVQPSEGQMPALDQGMLDILVAPEDYASPDHPSEYLLDERYVVMGCAANPVFDDGMTEDAFFAAGHVSIEIGRMSRTSFAELHLKRFGSRRRIEVMAASFLLAPELVIGTRRLTVIHERLATVFAKRVPVRYAPLPFDFPVMREVLQYNRTRTEDAGLRWMIERMKGALVHN